MTDSDQVRIYASNARRKRLASAHGWPQPIEASDALAAATTAGVAYDQSASPGDLHANIYRDAAAAEAWMEANLRDHGHPGFARVHLPDGRVIGILDLRPALEQARREMNEVPGE